MNEDEITRKIIGCCYAVYNELGPGFPEKIYRRALEKVLEREGVNFESEKGYGVVFDGEGIGRFKVDFVIESLVILEIKSVIGKMPKVFEAQVISYLKATMLCAALLVNFGGSSCQVRRLNMTTK
ncbi:MAG: GxxExxY protein [Candidatus Omnitrophica bacterium]|nr:GxxExxY protein [Candidatus Omnitrophota bacterium]MBU1128105.1 GxxExxY protein [Candidatus Omnitrophota bacterium]MBU1784499.1 GxxExxY protein [Candidatus Omnitrophota bacterium]MBU1851101.1 GxxExxY protein [Candidatus Omnitrophota bacterium]